MAVAAPVSMDQNTRGVSSSGCLQGTFIQLVDENRSWPKQRWQELFAQLDALKIKQLIVQWSVIDGQAFYKSSSFKPAEQPVLDWIMSLADERRMNVMVGLTHQSSHWKMVGNADQRPKYLTDELGRIAQNVDEIHELVKGHPSFGGWYISQEIDDLNWKEETSNEQLKSFLFQTTMLLKTVTPQAKIGISAFANSATAPQEIESFWSHILKQVPNLDTVYFQDGIGVHKLSLSTLPAYYSAMKSAVAANKREMVPVVELFMQTSGLPVNDGAFAATPAPLSRVLEQVTLAEAHASKHVAFSVPEYLSYMNGQAARDAFNSYIDYMKSKGLPCSVE